MNSKTVWSYTETILLSTLSPKGIFMTGPREGFFRSKWTVGSFRSGILLQIQILAKIHLSFLGSNSQSPLANSYTSKYAGSRQQVVFIGMHVLFLVISNPSCCGRVLRNGMFKAPASFSLIYWIVQIMSP